VTSRYGRRVELGISLVPNRSDLELLRTLARTADELGLDVIGIQDHPYQWRYLDTFTLIGDLFARTTSIHVFPDVANLPLRLPAVLAKHASSLDVASGGRFELGLGAGSFWEAIGAMGGPVRSPGEAIDALEDAIHLIRAMWSGERSVSFRGRHYSIRGVHPGEPPPHPIGIWLGVGKPRGLALAGRLADGWVPSSSWATPDLVPGMARHIDESARESGRDPAEIRRVYNVMGGDGSPEQWAETLARYARELGFDTFVLWPVGDQLEEVERFAREVAPALRALD
jgi:alkanesulfonate monooxygenase SsuD/methylene tetrahydromethanopterin reductase-like flavin-dependent oxidoreductase (luciferase family)